MRQISDIEVRPDGAAVNIVWDDGGRDSFHALWLRDNCPCADCRHPNGQKLTNIGDFSDDLRVATAKRDGDGATIAFSPGGHAAVFPAAWFDCLSVASAPPPRELWDADSLQPADISRDYAAVAAGGAALAAWLGLVVRYGAAVLRAAPTVPETVCRVAELFGHVRATNYGRFFDVQAVVNPNNLAYTGMALTVHTDNPYRDPPPSLQLLHCLQNSADGGESILIDGFMAAQVLEKENAEHWRLLAAHTVPFRFCDDTADLRSRLPVLDAAPDGALRAVNYNNRSIGALDLPVDTLPAYYAAYRHFADILQRPALNMHFKMESGDLFIVDNRRVLHGRGAFSGGGGRHLQGCYADMDALLSKWRVLGEGGEGDKEGRA